MPLMKLHVHKDAWTTEGKNRLLDVVHEVMVRCFRVPANDRYQILSEHPEGNLRALDTGLGFQRTLHFVLLEIVSRPRSKADKMLFYEELANALLQSCDLATTDLMISFVSNSDDDWSFGMGEAQFVTGSL